MSINKYWSNLISYTCTISLGCKWEFRFSCRQQNQTTTRKPCWKESVFSNTQPHPPQYTHHWNTKGGWAYGRVACVAFPCVLSPSGMKYSLADLNKLFRTFLSQSEKMLFKQALMKLSTILFDVLWLKRSLKGFWQSLLSLATVSTAVGQLCSYNTDSCKMPTHKL